MALHRTSIALQPRRFGLPEFHARHRAQLEVFFAERKLDDVLRRRKPAMIFWASMTDLFGDWVPLAWIHRCFEVMSATPHLVHQVLTKRPERAVALAAVLPWPPNLWFGVSVEHADYTGRLDVLRQLPAAVRLVSFEPLLGALGPVDLRDIHCVIVGGESGPRHRPMEIAWLTDLVAQCDAAGVRVFVKQDAALRDGRQGLIPPALWRRKEFPA
jgi:protein gp37